MSTGHTLNEFHVLGMVDERPTLMRIRARNGKEALTIASRTGTMLVVLFATKAKATH